MGLKSSPDFLAVSGRAAGDISLDGNGGAQLVNMVGELARGGHEVEASPEFVDVRDVALRSPIIYSRNKVEKLGSFARNMEVEGVGDMDVSATMCWSQSLSKLALCSAVLAWTTTVHLVVRLLSYRCEDSGRMAACVWDAAAGGRYHFFPPGSSSPND